MTVDVTISPAPFARQASHLEQPEGRTVCAMLVDAVRTGAIDADDLPRTSIYVDGEALDRETALEHVLRAGQVVNVVVEAHGGGGGRKDIGQVLLTIAVIAVSAWVGGPAGPLAAASNIVRQVAAATVLTLGQAAVAAAFAPDRSGQAKANDRYALQAASNQYRPWSPFPLALGEVHAAPDLAVKTFTQARGDDVWIYGILGLHYGPCVIDELKIGDTLVSSMGSNDVQTVAHLTPGPRTFSLYPNDVDQADFQEELEATPSSATPVVRAASSEGQRFEFDFFLPGGLHFQKDDGRVLATSVSVAIRYRAIDSEGAPIGAWTTGTTLSLNSTTKEPWRVMTSLTLPLGRYEFEFTRSLMPDDNPKRRDDIGLTAIRAIAFRKPITNETLSVLEFAVRATALNQGTLAPITCRITPVCETWTGAAWGTPEPTSNPAALTRWLMTGPAGARPLTSDQADQGLRAWSALCDAYDWTAHHYVTGDMLQDQALGLLEQSGRASIFWDGRQLVGSCWVEKPSPVQLFAGANLRDHRWSLIYPEPVHALRVEFQNLDAEGEPDEIYVYADGYAETAGPGVQAATLIEGLRLEGQKRPERAWRDGRWELGRRQLQRRVDTWTVDAENLVSRFGDRVRLAWLRVESGQSARVRCRRWSGGLVVGLRLNQPLTFIAGEDYAVDLRLNDQLLTAVSVVNPAVDEPVSTREVTFLAPRTAAVSPKAGDLIVHGTPDRISEDVEIIGMTPGEDLSCVVTGVRYVAPALIAGETGPIPELQSRLTLQRRQDPPRPTLLGTQIDENGVRIGFGMPPWRGSPITGFTARWRPAPQPGETAGWVDLPDLPAGSAILTTPPLRELPIDVVDETRIQVEIRAQTASGRISPPLEVTVALAAPAPPPTGDWTVVPRPPSPGGGQQPGVVVGGTVTSDRAAFVLIEVGPAATGPWRQVYYGPPTTEEVPIDNLDPYADYWLAYSIVSIQGVRSTRTVQGPIPAPGLVADDVLPTGPTIAGVIGDLSALFDDVVDVSADVDAAEALIASQGAEIAAARGASPNLNARITTVNQARIDGDAANATAITALDARTDDTEAGILDLEVAVAAETTARAAAITQVTARRVDLPNMLRNSTAAVDLSGWTPGAWIRFPDNNEGTFFFCNAAGTQFCISENVPGTAGQTYTVSFGADSAGGDAGVYAAAYNGDTLVADGLGLLNYTSTDWRVRRACPSFTLPAGANAFRIVLRKGATAAYSGVKMIMVNLGSVAQDWRDDTSLRVLGAGVTEQSLAIVDLETQNATAAWSVVAAASGGLPARLGVVSSTLGNFIALDAPYIFFGDDTVFDDTANAFITTFGDRQRIIAMGQPLGPSSDIWEWEGAASVHLASVTTANADYARVKNGKQYRRGVLQRATRFDAISTTASNIVRGNLEWQPDDGDPETIETPRSAAVVATFMLPFTASASDLLTASLTLSISSATKWYEMYLPDNDITRLGGLYEVSVYNGSTYLRTILRGEYAAPSPYSTTYVPGRYDTVASIRVDRLGEGYLGEPNLVTDTGLSSRQFFMDGGDRLVLRMTRGDAAVHLEGLGVQLNLTTILADTA